MFTDEFKTIEARADAVITDRGCRFIAVITPVDTEEKAEAFVKHLKDEHSDALDCIYAIRLGLESDRTAKYEGSDKFGAVILNILETEDVTNVVLAVVREAQDTPPKSASEQAFRDAGLNALRRSKVVTRILYDLLRFQISRDDLETVSRLITDNRGKVVQTVNEPDLVISVKIRKIQSEALKKILTDATHGRTKVL
jgi:putative IMPACT (imprinted ancient) family translation regulator